MACHENTYLNYAHSLLETSSPFEVEKRMTYCQLKIIDLRGGD